MRNLLIIAVLAAMTYAFTAQAFTPVVTALPAFSFFTVQNIQRNFGMKRWFCSRCDSDRKDGFGRTIHGGGTAYDPYFDNPNRH